MQPKPSTLNPVDWEAITPHYRADIRSLRSLKAEFGVSPSAILKHFSKRGIMRDLEARIHFEAQIKVNKSVLNAQANAEAARNDGAIIDLPRTYWLPSTSGTVAASRRLGAWPPRCWPIWRR